MREGQLEEDDDPTLLIWKNPHGDAPPPTRTLQRVHGKWQRFATRFAEQVAAFYGSAGWQAMWSAIVERYHHLSFRDLVRLPELKGWRADNPGEFGGLGMTSDESAIFYAIGIGDGSWGAFYDVCCLYPLRTAIFGFSNHLQLVHGRVDDQGQPLAVPGLGSQACPIAEGYRFRLRLIWG